MNKNIIITVLVGIIMAGGGFWGGMKYQESRKPVFSRQFGGPGSGNGGQSARGANRMGFRPTTGEIISSDDKSITVKLPDNSSKIILLSEKTEINKADKATKDELKIGERVAVFGQENSDGSVTAQNIQLNSIMRASISPQPNSK